MACHIKQLETLGSISTHMITIPISILIFKVASLNKFELPQTISHDIQTVNGMEYSFVANKTEIKY